jgi:hypothetical protein
MEPIKAKWIDYGSTNDNNTSGTVTDLDTKNVRHIRFSSATTLDTLADGLTPGSNLPRELMITNITGGLLIVKNEGSGTASNRILTGTGADVTMADGASAYLRYDVNSSRWRIVGQAAGGSAVVSPGIIGKLPYYNGITTIDDTASGTLTEGLFWDNSNRRFGINADTPQASLHLLKLDANIRGNAILGTGSYSTPPGFGSIWAGDNLTTSATDYCWVFGKDITSAGPYDLVHGESFTNLQGSYNFLNGKLHTTSFNSTRNIINGSTVLVGGTSYDNIFTGFSYSTSGTVAYSFIGGINHASLSGLSSCLIIGNIQNIESVNYSLIGGSQNVVRGAHNSLVSGNSNKTRSYGSAVGGTSNIVWESPQSSFSVGFAWGAGLRVVGQTSTAFGGDSSNINLKSYAAADFSFMSGGLQSEANSKYGRVEGRESIAGNKSYTWTRTSASSTTINISVGAIQPSEFTGSVTSRFYDMAGTDGFLDDVTAADISTNFVSYTNPTLVVSISNAASLGSKTSGRIVVTSNTEYAVAGGYQSWARFRGQEARANGSFSSAGDAQYSTVTMLKQTTDATPTILSFDKDLNKWLHIPLNTSWAFTITVVGKKEGAATSAFYKFEGLVNRQTGTPVIAGTPAVTFHEDDPAWNCSLSAGSTSLDIVVTGVAATNIKWVARVELTEVTTD